MVPSELFLILVFAIPSRGATRIPSVRTANPTLTALSSAFSVLSAGLLAISFATIRATISRFPCSLVSLRISSATPSTW